MEAPPTSQPTCKGSSGAFPKGSIYVRDCIFIVQKRKHRTNELEVMVTGAGGEKALYTHLSTFTREPRENKLSMLILTEDGHVERPTTCTARPGDNLGPSFAWRHLKLNIIHRS